MTHTCEQDPLSSQHIFSFLNRPINIECGEEDIPVQPLSPLTPTPFFLRPLMLWQPINWLLSNCLSFRLCPCPGPSEQTRHPAGRGTQKTQKNCPGQKPTSAPRLGKLNPSAAQSETSERVEARDNLKC